MHIVRALTAIVLTLPLSGCFYFFEYEIVDAGEKALEPGRYLCTSDLAARNLKYRGS